MMQGQKIQKDRIKTIGGIALLVCALLAIAAAFFLINLEERKRVQPPEFLTFTGLPESTKIEAVLTTRSGTVSLPVENGIAVLSEEQRNNFYLPFKLDVHLQDKDGKYHDLTITMDSAGVHYNVLFDGFRPQDRIYITMNGAESSADYYTDWSGRYLAELVFNIGDQANACLRVETKTPFGFCQSFPARKEIL
ncbi:MAG: hypothetical protein DI626_01815 [Micavibrio aeruginosavorus]|uniref:Uncharacterized protein n=1 Tax=Micavibrio aeruginosavorus TaxID=349221 RepID=A0A2W5A1E6_9BACT|nr:MAG: hypothetical protein DI626_01815 [Micavibrio aeruginosavorus]